MSIRFAVLSTLLILVPSVAWAQSSFTYNLLVQTPDGQSFESDNAPFAPLGHLIQTVPGDFMANANADADCGRLQIGGGASATGPGAGGPSALTNPGAGFSDAITITAPGASGTGTFIARFDVFGLGTATVDDPFSGAQARSSFFLNGSMGSCGTFCNYRRVGSWNHFNDETVYSGDPDWSFETDPTLFAFGLPVPVGVGISMTAQATAPLDESGATAGGNFVAYWSVVEVQDSAGNIVEPTILADSGCEYVPEPFAPMLGVAMLAALVRSSDSRRRSRNSAATVRGNAKALAGISNADWVRGR